MAVTTEPVTISIPSVVLEEIDATRGDVNRSRWILRAIEAKLDERGNLRPRPQRKEREED